MLKLLNKMFDQNKKDLKRLDAEASKVMELDEKMQSLSDSDLKAKTKEFQDRYKNGESLDEMKIEAFAVAREASRRVLGMHPYKVQIMGALVLHDGDISEMKTGEGKTLTATMAVYLNAISGKGVHVVTVNEYLSKRDAEEMGELYNWLGLSVGLNHGSLTQEQKKLAYSADITYSTNNELGFDYLRDNMATKLEARVQRPLYFAVIDEVDSVLIDEARTPLIISGNSNMSPELYKQSNMFMTYMKPDIDYKYDEETNSAVLTPEGIEKAERSFKIDNLYNSKHSTLNHAISKSLDAHVTLHENIDYVVQDGEIILVDKFTGRLMKGRRFSDGLHQALEAKEGLEIQRESTTMATVTFQNYFRMYEKLSGMTGTAETEKEELLNVYNMNVVIIPTHKPIAREDKQDVIYTTLNGKFKAVVKEVKERHSVGQPVLIGTVAIETSEALSAMLTAENIPHNVLNAKKHESEAEIIAGAGKKGAVTIATNMAGRGTDIKPGEGVLELGGLAVIGTERHESRRIDNQLRGRSGRQGNVGVTQFYLSLEDELMVRLGAEKMKSMMDRLGVDEETPIQAKMISKAVESAQKQAEGSNYEARKRLLQYDEVLREQRELIYKERDEVLTSENVKKLVQSMIDEVVGEGISTYLQGEEKQWDLEGLAEFATMYLGNTTVSELEGKTIEEIETLINEKVSKELQSKEEIMGAEQMRAFEKHTVLNTIDTKWVAHIDAMEHLRQGIHLRAYAQIEPLREYQQEGFAMFQDMVGSINKDIASRILKSVFRSQIEDRTQVEQENTQEDAQVEQEDTAETAAEETK